MRKLLTAFVCVFNLFSANALPFDNSLTPKPEAFTVDILANETPKPVISKPLEFALDNNTTTELPSDFYYENNIYYDYNKINFRLEAIPTLDSLVKVMQKFPDLNIELEGHTDSRGKSAYNFLLSKKRANKAAQYLVQHGISRKRIKLVAKGENNLANDCNEDIYCNETAHKTNRRTVIRLKK